MSGRSAKASWIAAGWYRVSRAGRYRVVLVPPVTGLLDMRCSPTCKQLQRIDHMPPRSTTLCHAARARNCCVGGTAVMVLVRRWFQGFMSLAGPKSTQKLAEQQEISARVIRRDAAASIVAIFLTRLYVRVRSSNASGPPALREMLASIMDCSVE